ncbi:MAG: hypothetical protein L6R38_002914 [Xanthoria sp. 2 TBL-2021]|nr:MAG: hypothetical protein L6R38_002914 [Xanthoria sp. 2 TBL-2021]
MLRSLTRWPLMSTSITESHAIVIVGTTGVGKSQLAVTLAERYNGEIINGDALQMYDGLPIATNKLPIAERKSIPHHLLGCIRLEEETWTVGKYVRSATAVIEDVIARGKLPIVVGGTHYYTQSLLFEDSLIKTGPTEHLSAEAQEKRWPILGATPKEMLEWLRVVDPEIAARWHPNDRRKIRHSLEVYFTSGRKPSDVYREQQRASSKSMPRHDIVSENTSQETKDAGRSSSPMRFNPLILWVHADLDKLSSGLDRRVDQMVDTGLIDEVRSMHGHLQTQERSGTLVDQSRGIWTAIGFKELLPYVLACAGAEITVRKAEGLKKQAIELTKTATRQYAKQQQRWIRGKLLRALQENDTLEKLIILDGTELSQWLQNVEAIAVDAVDAFLKGDPLPKSTLLPTLSKDILVPKAKGHIKARYCDICNITMMTQQEWDAHPRSKKHRKAARTPVDWQALYPRAHHQDNLPEHDDR